MRRQDGFTLIELLIVLAILGILVGVVSMSVNNLTQAADGTAKKSEAITVQTAMDTYRTQDELVSGVTDTITTRSLAAVVMVDGSQGDAPFVKYLKKDTKYEYTWTISGTQPYSVTVH